MDWMSTQTPENNDENVASMTKYPTKWNHFKSNSTVSLVHKLNMLKNEVEKNWNGK